MRGPTATRAQTAQTALVRQCIPADTELLLRADGLISRLGLLATDLEYIQLRLVEGQRAVVFQEPARGEGLDDGHIDANLSQTISVTLSLIR